MPHRIASVLLALFACSWGVASRAGAPQGTAFSYQGLLKQNGTPYSGNADLVFGLYDAPSGGTQVGATLAFTAQGNDSVPVANGVFDVTLDFGPGAFNGATSDERYLQITVNGNAIAPRTKIENAPYALQARTAELSYGVSDGSIGAAQIDPAAVQKRVAGQCAAGSSIRVVNGDGTVQCQQDANSGGTVTGVTAGLGLSGGGNAGNVPIAVSLPFNLTGADSLTGLAYIKNTQTGAFSTFGLRAEASSDSGTGLVGVAISPNGDGIGVAGGSAAPGGTGAYGLHVASSGAGFGVYGTTSSTSGTGAAGYADAATGSTVGVLGHTQSNAGLAVSGVAGGSGVGVSGTSVSGTGVRGLVTSPSGLVGAVDGTVGGNGFGVYGHSPAGPGGAGVKGDGAYVGVWGYGTGVAGVFGSAADSASFGVWGDSKSGFGVRGESGTIGVYGGGRSTLGDSTPAVTGVAGSGVTGVYGYSQSAAGYGVEGYNVSSGPGVYAHSSGGGGNGVYATGATALYGVGTSRGIYAEVPASTTNGFGVYAYSKATTGPGNGVYGESDSGSGVGVSGYSSSGIGVAGSSNTGWAGKFFGNVQVTGSLSKGAGSFQIDHPLDPANKYLFHSFVESPDMKNVYDGVATLDARGEAWVQLPDYFEALNQDYRYQLTALGRPAAGLYVADEVKGNRFRIAGGGPGQRISWQVTGVRHDAYAEAHRIVPEVAKSKDERGKYLYPALFGEPESKSLARAPKPNESSMPKSTASPKAAHDPGALTDAQRARIRAGLAASKAPQ